jgi:hypothetical protein
MTTLKVACAFRWEWGRGRGRGTYFPFSESYAIGRLAQQIHAAKARRIIMKFEYKTGFQQKKNT